MRDTCTVWIGCFALVRAMMSKNGSVGDPLYCSLPGHLLLRKFASRSAKISQKESRLIASASSSFSIASSGTLILSNEGSLHVTNVPEENAL